jgi:hypothetical protein
MSMCGIVLTVAFQSTFRLEIYQNNILLFFYTNASKQFKNIQKKLI